MMISKWFQAHFYVSRLTSRSNLFNNNVVQNLSGITYKVRGFDEEIYRVHQDAHKESPESLLVFKATWKIVRKEIELKLGGRFTAERFLNQTSLEPTSTRVQRWFYSKGRSHSCTVSVYWNGRDIFLQYQRYVTLALQVPSCLLFDTLSETAVLSQLADEKSSTANVKFQIYENNTKCRTGSPGHTRDRVLTV